MFKRKKGKVEGSLSQGIEEGNNRRFVDGTRERSKNGGGFMTFFSWWEQAKTCTRKKRAEVHFFWLCTWQIGR